MYSLYGVFQANAGKLDTNYLRWNLLAQSAFTQDREVMTLLDVDPGEYVVVPYTMYANVSDEFLLTVYSKAGVKAQ